MTTVVVCRAQHHNLTNCGTVLFCQILIHSIFQSVGLNNTLAGRTQRRLNELTCWQNLIGRTTTTMLHATRHKRLGSDVQTDGNLLIGVAIDRVVQARPAVYAGARSASVLEYARVVIGVAGLSGNIECLANVGHDGHVGHHVKTANIADSALGGPRNVKDRGVFFSDFVFR